MPELSFLLGSAKDEKKPRLRRHVPQTALPEACFTSQSLLFLRLSLFQAERDKLFERHLASQNTFDRQSFADRGPHHHIKRGTGRIHDKGDLLTCQLRGKVVGFAIDQNATIGANQAGKGAMMVALKPAVGLHRFGQDWQLGQCLEYRTWWSIATGPPLMR